MGVGVIAILMVMVIPLPPIIIDLLLSLSVTTAIVILLMSMFVLKPLDFSVFPSVLLTVTLFRLSLNVASSRLILLHGNEGTGAAGQVIKAFGTFVVGGNYVVGLIVFTVLTLINFVVITKGAGRIAEVSARFTLDAMPGKQMSIDADLNAGLINEDDARRKGMAPEEFAAKQAELWKNGLASWGQDASRIRRLKDAADFAVYTPGSTAGLPVSILKSFSAPGPGIVDDPELLRERVNAITGVATELTLRNRRWLVRTADGEIEAKNVILAVGSVPRKLDHPHLTEIPIEVALNPRLLEQLALDDATVAVFGSSHSSMVALPNLLATQVHQVVNFYRSPTKYAVYLDDQILFDDTGLKGNAAEWSRQNIDGTYPERLQRYRVNSPEFAEQLQRCTHAVYTVGFDRRQLPATPQWGELEYDPANGILAPGLFGVGIAFPEYGIDSFGSGQYRIGLSKFMQRLNTALPLWLRYST